MDKLLPCPFCGESHALGDGEGDDNWFECMFCHARGPRTTFVDATDTDADREAWNRRASADPALLALAKFGARIVNDYHRGKWGFISADGDWLDIDAASAGVKEYAGAPAPAPGIASAIARLLAPDGAGEVAPDGAGEVADTGCNCGSTDGVHHSVECYLGHEVTHTGREVAFVANAKDRCAVCGALGHLRCGTREELSTAREVSGWA